MKALFEQVWLSHDNHLDHVVDFAERHLLKGPDADDRLRLSHL
jgi:hypothetical protein